MADFYFLGNASLCQMFGCVVQTKTKTVVIDGGHLGDSQQLLDFLRTKANCQVDAWFFTHPHSDHIGAFSRIRKAVPEITVCQLLYCFPNVDQLRQLFDRGCEEYTVWEEISQWEQRYPTHRLSAGDTFRFDDVTIRTLRVFNSDIIPNYINNSSAVFRIEGPEKSVLILGDLGIEGGREVMENCPLSLLQADYTQMAHHGQQGVAKEFYQHIRPQRCLWPAPQWLWDNEADGRYNEGPFLTVQTRQWMEELGVTEHFVEKDGTQRIPI